jgi:hypothetical protein
MPESAWHIKLQPGQPYLSPGQEMEVEIDVPMAKATGQFVRPLPRFGLPVLPHSYLYGIVIYKGVCIAVIGYQFVKHVLLLVCKICEQSLCMCVRNKKQK